MRRILYPISLVLGTVLFTGIAYSQADRFAYAITDIQKEGANWSFLKKVNLQNGEYSQVLLNGNDMNQVAFDASSKKQIQNFDLGLNILAFDTPVKDYSSERDDFTLRKISKDYDIHTIF